jgi:hypothetical protein
MNIVELWKSAQLPATREFEQRLRCGIFVPRVENRCRLCTRFQKQCEFSSSLNKISIACSRNFHNNFIAKPGMLTQA